MRPSVQRQGWKMDAPLSFMYHCLSLLNKNARPSKTVRSSNEPTSFLAEVLMSEGFLCYSDESSQTSFSKPGFRLTNSGGG